MEDAQYEQRNNNIITKVEFEEIMAKLGQELEETVTNEIGMYYRMSGVMVQMLLFEAE